MLLTCSWPFEEFKFETLLTLLILSWVVMDRCNTLPERLSFLSCHHVSRKLLMHAWRSNHIPVPDIFLFAIISSEPNGNPKVLFFFLFLFFSQISMGSWREIGLGPLINYGTRKTFKYEDCSPVRTHSVHRWIRWVLVPSLGGRTYTVLVWRLHFFSFFSFFI